MQVIRILISHYVTPNVRRIILVIWEPDACTQDLGEVQGPASTHIPAVVVGYLKPMDEVPFGLWAEGNIIPYKGPQYHSTYLPQRAGYLIRDENCIVVWFIHYPCWTSRARESETYILDDRGGGRGGVIIALGRE